MCNAARSATSTHDCLINRFRLVGPLSAHPCLASGQSNAGILHRRPVWTGVAGPCVHRDRSTKIILFTSYLHSNSTPYIMSTYRMLRWGSEDLQSTRAHTISLSTAPRCPTRCQSPGIPASPLSPRPPPTRQPSTAHASKASCAPCLRTQYTTSRVSIPPHVSDALPVQGSEHDSSSVRRGARILSVSTSPALPSIIPKQQSRELVIATRRLPGICSLSSDLRVQNSPQRPNSAPGFRVAPKLLVWPR